MILATDSRIRRAVAVARASLSLRSRVRSGLTCACLVWIIFAIALAGCGDGPGTLLVDPGHYSVMHCKDLIAQHTTLLAREQALRKLQAQASEGTGGSVIGKMAYGADYETALTDQKIVEREAHDKNCTFTPTYQSDQTIR